MAQSDDDPVMQRLNQPFFTSEENGSSETTAILSSENSIQHKAPPSGRNARSASVEEEKNPKALMFAFLLMIFFGLGNKIFQVLMMIPMYNYPLFINLLTTAVYIPVSFAYVIPMIKYGTQITKEAQEIPKYKFAIMGLLDSFAGIMQTLAVNYIQNGTLVVLLIQAAIPVSLVISYYMLHKRYKNFQYIGSTIVVIGIVLVLIPSFEHPDSKSGNNVVLWSVIMVLSCVPMCLSSVYKEIALGDADIDAVYMNGWIAVYQLLASFPLLLPGAPASNLAIPDIPANMWYGMKCLVGMNTYDHKEGSILQDDCKMSPIYVFVYLVFNIAYNILILLILKYGSANVLWLALTIMVPLANLSFTLSIMPASAQQPLTWEDIVGLVIIMIGLFTYRFWGNFAKWWKEREMAKPHYAPLVGEAPSSPFLTSKSADDVVSTPGRGGVHTTHHHKQEREKEREKQDEGRGKVMHSSRAAVNGHRSHDDSEY